MTTFSLLGSPAVDQGPAFGAVLVAARAGADWAWTRLYRAIGPPVHAYLETHDALDAEASVGAVFCRVADGINGFDGDQDDLRRWALRIARDELDGWNARFGRAARSGPTVIRLDGLPPMSPDLEWSHVTRAVAISRTQTGALRDDERAARQPPQRPPPALHQRR